MSDFNIDENTVKKLKDMVNEGDFSNILSQVPPEMMQNISSMMNNSNNSKTNSNDNVGNNSSTNANYNNANENNSNSNNNFDFSKIDMNSILKMKSIIEKMNNTNDPRSNLLYSLKPYLREGRREKLDQYANLMNVAKIAELLKNDSSENKNNG